MQRILRFALASILALTLAIPVNAAPQSQTIQQPQFAALTKALDQTIDKNIRQGLITGAVVLVSYDGQLIYHRAAGYAAPEKKIPMQENSLFRLASVSKAFTSMAAGALIQQGKLSLDDPVSKWLPDFQPSLPDGKKPQITVKHLLTHTSGLDYRFFQPTDGPYSRAGVSDGLEKSDITLDENIQRIASAPLLFEPGTHWHYSLSMDVLGGIISKVNNSSLPEAMTDLVTGPLGMKNTTFYVDKKDYTRMVVPYYLNKGKLIRMKETDDYVPMGKSKIHFSSDRAFDRNAWPSGGAGLVSTGSDVMILLEAIRKGNSSVVGHDLMKEMRSNQTHAVPVMPGTAYGLGWAVLTDPIAAAQSPQSVGTVFWSGVYGSNWFIDPAKKLSVVTMTSTAFDGLTSKGLAGGIRDALYANLP